MARGKPVGTAYAELDLDSTKLEKGLTRSREMLISGSMKVEDAYKSLGLKSERVYEKMRENARLASDYITKNTIMSEQEILRVKEATARKINSLNEQQYGKQASLIETLKKNWLVASAAIAGAVMAIGRAYDSVKSAAALANDIERQARVLGMSTDALQKLQYTAKMADVEATSLAQGVKLLSRNMEDAAKGSGEASKYFQAMGVSVKDAHGNLRPLDAVMGDVADKFASWEDGPRKIAIALALFGRAGEQMIPLLNQGSAGMKKFGEEADKLGVILSPGLIKKGSELEDQFKKLEASTSAIKTSFILSIIPMRNFGDEFASMAKKISAFFDSSAGKLLTQGFLERLPGGIGAAFSALKMISKPPPEEDSEIRRKAGWTAKGSAGGMPPDVKAMEEAEKKRLEEQKRVLELRKKLVSEIEDLENKMKGMGASPWGDSEPLGLKKGEIALYHWTTDLEEIYGYSKETVEEFRALGIEVQNIYTINRATITTIDQEVASAKALEQAYKKVAISADEFISSNEQILAIQERTTQRKKEEDDVVKQLNRDYLESRNTMADRVSLIREETSARLEQAKEKLGTRFTPEMEQQIKDIGAKKEMEARLEPVKQYFSQFESIWTQAFANMAQGTMKFKDAFKASLKSMLDAFVQMVTQMIARWIMLATVKLALAPITGGASMMPTPGLGAEGGVFNRPTNMIIGESGPEAVVPLKGGAIPVKSLGKSSGGGGNTYVFISSPDAEGVQRLFEKNSGALVQVISDNLNDNGSLRGTIRGVM